MSAPLRARRISAARKRFEAYAAEMREWGCDVTIPEHLTVPPPRPEMPNTNQRRSAFRRVS